MALPRWLRRQLAGPSGWLAEPTSVLLDRVNRAEYAQAIPALESQGGDTVLELGFGGGVGVRALLALEGVRVVAAEPSEELRARAYRRFAGALAQGRLTVWAAGAEDLPAAARVDRAVSMNTVYFWRDVDAGFARLAEIVGRRVVLGIAGPQHLREAGFAEDGVRVESLEWYAERLSAAGFEPRVRHLEGTAADLLIGDRRCTGGTRAACTPVATSQKMD
jgi:arsenite methyltransferase